MRIHGVHLQGLREPTGNAQLALDPAWATVPSGDPARREGMARLLRALLFPDRAIGRYGDWVDLDSSSPARAGLSFSAEGESYRLIVDFARERLVLGRLDRESGSYARVSTEPEAIAAKLALLGLPRLDDYTALAWIGIAPAEGPPSATLREARTPPRVAPVVSRPSAPVAPAPAAPAPEAAAREPSMRELARLERELARAEVVEHARAELRERIATRQGARERLLEAERELKAARQELEQLAPLADGLDELDERIRRYHALVQGRDTERAALERARQELLGERARLRVVPNAQRAWTILGLVLGATGAAAGAVAHPGFGLLGLAGVALAIVSLALARRARRGMGAIDARLAALRVRERAIERHFEAEGAPVRVLLRTLSLEGVDGLEAAVARYRTRQEELVQRKRALSAAQRSFPEGAEADLAELEQRLAALPPERDLETLRAEIAALATTPAPPPPARAPEPPESGPPQAADAMAVGDLEPGPAPAAAPRSVEVDPLRALDAPERTIRAAAAWLGRPEGEIAEALAPALPVYLRSLTKGAILAATPGPDGLEVRLERGAQPVLFAKLPEDRRVPIALALRLALLERLAPRNPLPVIVHTDGLGLEPEVASALSRALRRLSAVTQIVQLA
jgi:hypothetical protein